jgi:hypothetical protein
MATAVKTCIANCKHEYQDKKYGKGKRVHNLKKASTGSQEYTCTVCRKERT